MESMFLRKAQAKEKVFELLHAKSQDVRWLQSRIAHVERERDLLRVQYHQASNHKIIFE